MIAATALAMLLASQVVPVDNASAQWQRERDQREQAYADAHAAALRDGESLVIMVGAPWCEHCIAQEKEFTDDQVERIAFVHLDIEDPSGARLVPRGQMIPQTHIFWRVGNAWKGHKFVGRIHPRDLTTLAAERRFTLRRRRP